MIVNSIQSFTGASKETVRVGSKKLNPKAQASTDTSSDTYEKTPEKFIDYREFIHNGGWKKQDTKPNDGFMRFYK